MKRRDKGRGPGCLRQLKKYSILSALLGVPFVIPSAFGAPTPPSMTVCDGVACANLENAVCSDAGFSIGLKSYIPGATQSSGATSYVYEISSPPAGTCSSTVRPGEPCLDNSFCRTKGNQSDPAAYCSRECAVDTFRGLSHFDATFPQLTTASCVSPNDQISGSCSAVDKNNDGVFPTVGNFVRGDASCFSGDSSAFVAKCDGTNIEPGDCIEMTLSLSGETTGLGRGAAIVVDKEGTSCTSSCLAGPSCESCDPDSSPNHCLTRTIGFWGTHPWITNDFSTDAGPVTVCGRPLDCDDLDDGMSNPSCLAGTCDSVMEGLGSNPGGELSANQTYVSLVKQLTAAKLNFRATTMLAPTGSAICTDWTYRGKTISEWFAYCEGLCGASKSQISGSGCIEALDAFNNSEDSGFEQTPGAFAQPSIDDHGITSGADPVQFTRAQGKYTPPGKVVIGKSPAGGLACQ